VQLGLLDENGPHSSGQMVKIGSRRLEETGVWHVQPGAIDFHHREFPTEAGARRLHVGLANPRRMD
jgi:hypothetical protein